MTTRLTIFTVVRDDGQACDAKFIGFADDGWAESVQWLTGGRADAYNGNPNLARQNTTLPGVKGVELRGKLPVGDRFHDWAASDFAFWIPDSASLPAAPAPHGQFTIPAQTVSF